MTADRTDEPAIRLRPARPDDVPVLFAMQLDDASNAMAGTKPRPMEQFAALWRRAIGDPASCARVIVRATSDAAQVVGSVSSFEAQGRLCVGYWIAREHWGLGIASRALAMFVEEERRRPLYATTARANEASRRVLARCGFRLEGLGFGEETERYAAGEIAEFVLE